MAALMWDKRATKEQKTQIKLEKGKQEITGKKSKKQMF